ncbi:MAG: hypothetical protein KDD66_07835 [Bdellovibrionales bacterium]|nr:hypothetical protein [Bdellovibrionales bacterium]
MLKTLRFFGSRLIYPQLADLGFLVSGLAIERRRKRLAQFWDPHLENSKNFQKSCIKSGAQGESLAVLGAGRLYDVALEDLADAFTDISLFDADPQCLRYWKRASKMLPPHSQFSFHIGDITCVLLPRLHALRSHLSKSESWDQALDYLAASPDLQMTPPSAFLSHDEFDAVLSINLLSQLPVYWQHIVETELKTTFGAKHVLQNEEHWLAAFIPSAKSLVEQHLRDLRASGARFILVITDYRYEHYYRDDSGNEVTEQIDALLGHEILDQLALQELFPNYDAQYGAEWDWHIAPLGRDRNQVGERHKVIPILLKSRGH